MLELGQPLHAFDFDLVRGGSIVVRAAKPDEKLVTLDGVERTCPAGSLLITDAGRAIAMAGVMGGLDTEITERTTRVFLESANFLRTSVRRTSRRLGLRSEASGRFEKGVDPAGTVRAIERASELLIEIGAARRVDGVVDVVAAPRGPQRIVAPVSYLKSLIGAPIAATEMVDLLTGLGIAARLEPAGGPGQGGVASVEDALYVVADVPTRRLDIEGRADLAEEIARAYGYDRIEPKLPTLAMPAAALPPRRKAVLGLRRVLLGCGLDELVTFAYHGSQELDRLLLPGDHPWRLAMTVLNPMSDEQAQMRTSLIPNVLRVASFNAGYGIGGMRLFEIGRAYLPKALPLADLPAEPMRLALLLTGPTLGPAGWRAVRRDADFYDLKGVVQLALDHFGVAARADYQPASLPFLHPGRTAEVSVDGAVLGWLGELNPDVAAGFDLRQKVCVAELDFDAIVALAGGEKQYGGLPRFPATERDLALVVPAGLAAAKVVRAIEAAGGALLEDVGLFDVYEGQQVADGALGLAFRLRFRAPDRTLTDAAVDGVMAVVVKAVEAIGGRVRG
jgi:phenylalanyl-tRNA synthetase beta chain